MPALDRCNHCLDSLANAQAVWIECKLCADGEIYYNQQVALPMSLMIIQARLQNHYYRQPAAVRSDALLIASNAALYNGEDSPIARSAEGRSLCSH